jgi:hypothetical protein
VGAVGKGHRVQCNKSACVIKTVAELAEGTSNAVRVAPHETAPLSLRTGVDRVDEVQGDQGNQAAAIPDSFALSSATTTELTGVAMPSIAPSRGMAPLMLSTSARLPAR